MTALRASQLFCAQTMRRHAKSFYLSTRILPRAKREAIEALYAFFRIVDDTADEGSAPLTARCAQLEHFRRDVEGLAIPGYRSCAPWFPALASAYRDFAFDLSPLLELIDGCESDLIPADIGTLEELEAYARAVAGTVGRSVIPILGASDPDSLERAELLGVAMQYTNVLRDVHDDRAKGRNYLPCAAFPGAAPSHVMRAIALRARALYREASVLAGRLPNDGSRAALLMATVFYENILSAVERRGFDTEGRRVYVTDTQKLRLAAQCMLSAYTGLAIIK